MHVLNRAIYFLLFLFMVAGCSENKPSTKLGPDSNNVDDPSKNPIGLSDVETNYLPYVLLNYSPGKSYPANLLAVNENNPSVTGTKAIEGGGSEIKVLRARFNHGNFDSGNQIISDFRLDTLLYVQNNNLFRTDLHHVKQPQRFQLSSEFQANSICHQRDTWAQDFANFSNSRYVYYVNSDCQDSGGEWHMVSLNMSNTEPPENLFININYLVTSVRDTATGALDGWLIIDQSGLLTLYDTEFLNGSSVKFNGASVQRQTNVEFLIDNKLGHKLIKVDENIVWYNSTNKIIDNKTQVFPAAVNASRQFYQWRSDGEFLYFSLEHINPDDSTLSASELYRVALSGTQPVELLMTEDAKIENIQIGDSGVYYSVNEKIVFYSTNNSLANIIVPPENNIIARYNGGQPVFNAVANRLFVEYVLVSDSAARTVNLYEGQQLIESLTNTMMIGVKYSDNQPLDRVRKIERIIIERGGVYSNTRKISSFFPVEYPTETIHGELPPDNNPHLVTRFNAVGHNKLLFQATINSAIDLFYIDLAKADSLLQVTNSQSAERVINF